MALVRETGYAYCKIILMRGKETIMRNSMLDRTGKK